MDRDVPDYFALALCLFTVGYAFHAEHLLQALAIVGACALALAWFPREIDELSFGSAWHYGHRVDAHTPPALIGALGWAGLVGCAVTAVNPGWFPALFG